MRPSSVRTRSGFTQHGQSLGASPSGFINLADTEPVWAHALQIPLYALYVPTVSPRTLTLPNPILCVGRWITVSNTNGTGDTVQVAATVQGPIGAVLAANTTATYFCNGTAWFKMIVNANT